MKKKYSDEEIRNIIRRDNENPKRYSAKEINKIIKEVESKVDINKLVKQEEYEEKAKSLNQQKMIWPSSISIEGKNYYTIEDLTKHYNVSKESIKSLIKKGVIKTINIGNHYMLIPQEKFFKKDKDYLDWIFRNNYRAVRNKNVNLSDKIRVNLVSFWIYLIFPGLSLLVFINIVGINNYLSSELIQLASLIVIVLTGLITHFLYKYIFSKYSDDLPD